MGDEEKLKPLEVALAELNDKYIKSSLELNKKYKDDRKKIFEQHSRVGMSEL